MAWDWAVLVYAIMTGVPIDVGMFIYDVMLRTVSRRSSGLWFPPFITMCREVGMVVELDMEIQSASGYIIMFRH